MGEGFGSTIKRRWEGSWLFPPFPANTNTHGYVVLVYLNYFAYLLGIQAYKRTKRRGAWKDSLGIEPWKVGGEGGEKGGWGE